MTTRKSLCIRVPSVVEPTSAEPTETKSWPQLRGGCGPYLLLLGISLEHQFASTKLLSPVTNGYFRGLACFFSPALRPNRGFSGRGACLALTLPHPHPRFNLSLLSTLRLMELLSGQRTLLLFRGGGVGVVVARALPASMQLCGLVSPLRLPLFLLCGWQPVFYVRTPSHRYLSAT